MTTHSHNPDIRCEFETRDGETFSTKALFRYQSERHLESPTAKAHITLRGDRWMDLTNRRVGDAEIVETLRSNDLCTVTMRDGKGDEHIDITGLLKHARPTVMEIDGRPEHRVELEIEGLGRELEGYEIFWHPHIAGRNNLGGVGWLVRSKGRFPKGRPDQVIKTIFDTFLNDQYIFRLPDGRTIGEALQLRFSEFPDSLAKTALKAMGMEASLWETLKRYSDAPWGELFVAIPHEDMQRSVPKAQATTASVDRVFDAFERKRGPAVYFRPTPFDIPAWDKLAASHGWGFSYADADRMDDGEVLDRDESRVYNFFWAPMRSTYSGFDQLSVAYNQSGGRLPTYDEEGIRRHGLRRLEQATEYVEMVTPDDAKPGVLTPAQQHEAKTSQPKLMDMLVKRTLQLYQWYGYDEFFDGTITTRGRIGPDSQHGAQIGSILTRERGGMEFYVTGIMQLWQMHGPHTTRWTVTRGRNPRQYKEWWQGKLASHKKRVEQSQDLTDQPGIGGSP